jgi:Homeodomain-like domain
MAMGSEILLTEQQHSDLSSIAQSRALPAGYVFRAKLILMLAEGSSFNAIKRQLQTSALTIVRWKQRFRQHGLEGLDTCFSLSREPDIVRCWVWTIRMRSGHCTLAKSGTSHFGITFGRRSKTIEAYESITSYYLQR